MGWRVVWQLGGWEFYGRRETREVKKCRAELARRGKPLAGPHRYTSPRRSLLNIVEICLYIFI
jgi:hypothetical protein